MGNDSADKGNVEDLCGAWEALLDVEGLSLETEYRIRKLINRAVPLADKTFLKTVKGKEMVLECIHRTRDVEHELRSNGESSYRLLTDLERAYEQLLIKTYEFRVKAG